MARPDPNPETLPDRIPVKLPDGTTVTGLVYGKRLTFPMIHLPNGGSVEVSPITIRHIVATSSALRV